MGVGRDHQHITISGPHLLDILMQNDRFFFASAAPLAVCRVLHPIQYTSPTTEFAVNMLTDIRHFLSFKFIV